MVTRRAAFWALGILFAANFLSYLDRQIVGALETNLKEAFNLKKAGFGLLASVFTVGYMVFAPIVGYLSDRVRRTWVLAACVAIWSLATVASGMAETKRVLYVARFLIGIGEAGCLVIGPTLIANYFSQAVRGKALSIFYLGLPLGGTAGYIVGGLVSEAFGWRAAFYVAGLPGLLVAPLLWFMKDPPRDEDEAPAPSSVGFKPYVGLLKNPSFLWIVLAQASAVIILVPLLYYGVGFFEEVRHMDKGDATLLFGIMVLVTGGLGNTLSGVIGDRLARRHAGAYAALASIAFLAGLPFLVVGFLAPSPWISVPALGVGAFCYFLCMPAVNTHIANVVPARQRAMAYAMAVFILHLLGDTGSPPLFGLVSDVLEKRTGSHEAALEIAFVGFSLALVIASVFAFRASKTTLASIEKFVRSSMSRIELTSR